MTSDKGRKFRIMPCEYNDKYFLLCEVRSCSRYERARDSSRPGEDTPVPISNRSAPHQRQRHRPNGIIRRDRHPHHSFVGRSRAELGDRVPSENERTGKRNGANEGEESSEWTLRHVHVRDVAYYSFTGRYNASPLHARYRAHAPIKLSGG